MRKLMPLAVAFLCFAAVGHAASTAGTSAPAKPDAWEPVRFLIGDWHGSVEGQSGTGTVVRSYAFVLADRFIEERNVSTYAAKEPGKSAEVHEHRGFLSYDKHRKLLVLRQFHEESFVNLYALNVAASTAQKLVFDSESFENFDNSWKARETYDLVSKDEFVETFELAPPGKPFELYSRNRFRRAGN